MKFACESLLYIIKLAATFHCFVLYLSLALIELIDIELSDEYTVLDLYTQIDLSHIQTRRSY